MVRLCPAHDHQLRGSVREVALHVAPKMSSHRRVADLLIVIAAIAFDMRFYAFIAGQQQTAIGDCERA